MADCFRRGDTLGPRWQPGACDNCASRAHRTKDCIERPRRIPARFSQARPSAAVAPAPRPKTFEERKDRYGGYDLDEHAQLIQAYALEEELREQLNLPEDVLPLDETTAAVDADEGTRNFHSLRSRAQVPAYLAPADSPSAPTRTPTQRLFELQEQFLAAAAPGGVENSAGLPTTAELLYTHALQTEKAREEETRQALEERYQLARAAEKTLRSQKLRATLSARAFDPVREEEAARRKRVTKARLVNTID